MDALPPTAPGPAPAPLDPPPAPRLWRHGYGGRGRRGPVFPAVLVLALVVAAVGFLASWVRPEPVPDVVQLWAVGTPARPFALPTAPLADRDRLAFTDPTRNGLARASGGVGGELRDPPDLLAALDGRDPGAALVVYLCARACCDPADGKTVLLLPDDARGGASRRSGWLPLREVFLKLAGGPGRRSLLVLDLYPVQADPRLGLLDDDVASAVRAELRRFPDYPGLVLASCDAGQRPLGSAALGRSAFGYYLEEGLRGWADAAEPGDRPDGRVTARELAGYVRGHVERWSRRTRTARQTPVLLAGEAEDFPLVVLSRGRRLPHLVPPGPKALPAYPPWLLAGWKYRDGLRRDGFDRDAPRAFAQVEAALLTAENDWRGAADPAPVRAVLAAALAALRPRFEPLRSFPRPRPASLALEEAAGRTPDAAAFTALKALLATRAAPAAGQKAAEAEAEATRSIAGFFGTLKPTTDFDLDAAAFRLAADPREPDRATLGFLARVLRTRHERPLYVETEVLRRLADLPPDAWRAATVRVALDVARRGEFAASRAGSFAWVRPLLDAAEQTRHEGETLLRARGYAPLDEADRLLRRADAALDEAVGAGDTVERARRLADEALARLPAALAALDDAPGLESAWFAAARDARAVVNELGLAPPADPSGALERVGTLDRLAAALDADLAALRAPYEAGRDARYAADPPATPEVYAAVSGLLDSPYPDAARRAALWAALLSVDRRLNEQTFRLDAGDGSAGPVFPPPRASDVAALSREARARLERRTRGAVELLALAGLAEGELGPLRGAPALVARAWAALPDRVTDDADPATADRVARLVSPLAAAPKLDAPETNPTRRRRVAEFAALRGWLADRFAFLADDLGGTAFEAGAAQEYRDGEPPTAPAGVAVGVGPPVPTLDPSQPVATVPLAFRLTGPAAEATARVDVVTADADWLEVKRGTPWPAARSPFPAVESSPPSFDLALSAPGSVTAPLEVRLRAGPEPTGTPVPLGFLVRSRLGTRSWHQRVRLDLVPSSRRLRVALSADPARPTGPLAVLRVRPVREAQGYSLYVENPTEADRPLLVQLLDGGVIVPGCEVPVTAKGRDPGSGKPRPTRVTFGAPAPKPEADLHDVHGPLRVRLLDAADPARVVAETALDAGVALARDYVRVVGAGYEPPAPSNDGKSRLWFRLRAVGPIAGPPCPVELVLAPDRVPGLLSAGETTFLRGELAAEGDEVLLFAQGLRLDERDDERGFADLAVDGVERAFVFRTTFARRGEPTTPRLDDRPAVRLKAPAAAFAGALYEVAVALDNPPPGGRLELTLGQYVGGAFRTDVRRELSAEKESLRVNPRGPGGTIRFEASVRDPSVAFDVRRVRGRRELRARLLNAEGGEEGRDALAVVFDDTAPAGVTLLDVPKYALKGSTLELRAGGSAPGAGVVKVVMFFGKPVDGKVPPNTPVTEGRPLDVGRTLWAAKLPVPDGLKGPVAVSVIVVSRVGLSASDTATVEVVDALPVEPGRLQGRVVEGGRPQPGFDVLVVDEKGAEKGRATTDRGGRFAFPALAPGAYRVVCFKPTPPTRGLARAAVAPGKVAEVTVEMFRTR